MRSATGRCQKELSLCRAEVAENTVPTQVALYFGANLFRGSAQAFARTWPKTFRGAGERRGNEAVLEDYRVYAAKIEPVLCYGLP